MLRAVVACLLLLASPALATHAPCPVTECVPIVPIPHVPYLSGDVLLDRVDAQVHAADDLVTTRLAFVLRNPGSQASQAIVTFPMPGGATLVGFNLTVDGTVLEGRVAERAQAQQAYDDAVAQGAGAALLRVANERRVDLAVNVPAGATRTVQAAYAEWAELAGGARIYRLPLSQLPATVGHLELAVDVAGQAVAAPVLPLAFQPVGAGNTQAARLSRDAPGALQDLLVTWAPPADWSAALIPSTTSGLGFAALEVCPRGEQVLARDVVFVIDHSGSMGSAGKMEEARDSLRAMLLSLSARDRYDIVQFDDRVEAYNTALLGPDAALVAAQRARLAYLQADGGTDIDGGLQQALLILAASPSDRLPMVVFLTDGLPSSGVVDHEQIITRFIDGNTRMARVHVIPIGLDADQTFLADLALRSGGSFTAIDPTDGLVEARLERLYDVLGQPMLRDATVRVDGIQAVDVLPARFPVLFEDACLHLAMKATFGADADVTVTGMGASGVVTKTFHFPAASLAARPEVGGLWGRAKVDELLSRERAGEQLRAQLIEVAVAQSQLTPYTSWVVTEVVAKPQPTTQNDVYGQSGGTVGGAPVPPSSSGTASASMTQAPGVVDLSRQGAGGGGGGAYDTAFSAAAFASTETAPATPAPASTGTTTPGLGLLALLAGVGLALLLARARRF